MKSKISSSQYSFILLYFSDVSAFLLSALTVCIFLDVNIMDPFYFRYFLFMLFVTIFMYSSHKLYVNKRSLFDDNDVTSIMNSNAMSFFSLLLFIIIFNPNNTFLILVTILVLLFSMLLTSILRFSMNQSLSIARRKGFDIKQAVYFGRTDDELLSKLKDNALGYNVIRITNSTKILEEYLKRADTVFLKMESIDDSLLELMIKNDHVDWKIISSILNLVIEPVSFDEFKDYPIINLRKKDQTMIYSYVKRFFDIILSSISLILLSPLFILLAAFIKMSSKGPIFFTQERLGQDLKPFRLYKFRTMINNADEQKSRLTNEVNGLFKMKKDPRITPIGRILRRTCIDELPQLINILKGEMSLVGPRPHLESELPNFRGWRMTRFNVKPGLTGMWQVNGRHELNFDKAVLYDVYYARHMSFKLDFSIILKTIPSIIVSKGRF